jgi:hypothetical protein
MGSMRLALFDRRGLARMDATQRGVWFSFLAPLAMLPFMLWFPELVDKDSAVQADADNLWWLRQVLGYLVALLGFPLAMYYITDRLKLRDRFKLMVAAMNWAAIWQTILVLAGYFLYLSDAVPFMLGNAALFIASGFTLVYLTYVMRVSLGVKTTKALAFVSLMALIQLLSYFLTQI